MYRDIMTLIAVSNDGKDPDGYPQEGEHSTEVFANKQSVKRSEFYASMQAGVNAVSVFKTRIEDFEYANYTAEDGVIYEPTRVLHEGRKYQIQRTYVDPKDPDQIELTCSDLGVVQSG